MSLQSNILVIRGSSYSHTVPQLVNIYSEMMVVGGERRVTVKGGDGDG